MMTTQQLIQAIMQQKALMITVATGGANIKSKVNEYQARRATIGKELVSRKLDDPNPFSDLWNWYGRWSNGDLPTYQSRRLYINDMYESLVNNLEKSIDNNPSQPTLDETGWPRVDRGIDKIRMALEEEKDEMDYQTVGLMCRETMISLAQAVYDVGKHKVKDSDPPSPTYANRMLEAYFGYEFSGTNQEALRNHSKAALKLANELQHKRTATFRDAALCAEATRTVVNIVAIVSGKRDPQKILIPTNQDDSLPF